MTVRVGFTVGKTMNVRMQRIQTVRAFDRSIIKSVPAFRRDIAAEKNRFIIAQMANYRRTGMLSQDLVAEHMVNMMAIFRRNYGRVMKVAAEIAPDLAPGIKSMLPPEKKFTPRYEDYLRRWFQSYGAAKARSTAQTTQDDIRKLLMKAFESEKPETEVIRAGLRARGLSVWRADTIARTETHQAASFASKESVEALAADSGVQVTTKIWNPVMDARTRDAHAAMAGSAGVPMSGMFEVGGELLDRPGDPAGSPENTINCRCVMTYEVDY